MVGWVLVSLLVVVMGKGRLPMVRGAFSASLPMARLEASTGSRVGCCMVGAASAYSLVGRIASASSRGSRGMPGVGASTLMRCGRAWPGGWGTCAST